MPRNLLFLFVFALAVYSLADVLSSDDQRRGGTPKFMWFIIVCIPVLGPVVWLVFVFFLGRERITGGLLRALVTSCLEPRVRVFSTE